jgi:hypothetical protein
MWLSLRRSARQAAWLAGSLAALYGAWIGISQVVAIDALAPLRNRPLPGSQEVGITLKGVEFVAWQEGRKVASGRAANVSVMRDRSRMILSQVTDGSFLPEKGEPIRFTTSEAEYSLYRRILSSRSQSRLTGPSLDVRASSFTWDELAGQVKVPGNLYGKLAGGEARGRNFTYATRTGDFTMGNLLWAGVVQDPSNPARKRRWEFRGEDIQVNGDIRVYLNGRATDGEVIVKAPRLEHNAKTDVLTATGGVRMWGEEANIAAPKVVVFRREGRSVASGGVSLYLKAEADKGLKEEELTPIPIIAPDKAGGDSPGVNPGSPEDQKRLDEEVRSARNLREYPAAIRAEEVTYWYRQGERRAILTGSPQARQELSQNRWRMIWAHSADYDGEGDWLTLKSRPGQKDCRLRASTGDDLKAAEVRASTKENDDRFSAKQAEGVSYVDDEEEIPRTGSTSPPPPPGSARA